MSKTRSSTKHDRDKTAGFGGHSSSVPISDSLGQLDMSDESRKIVNAITIEIDALKREFSSKLVAKNAEIDQLKMEVNSLRVKMCKVEEKIDSAEAYERRDTVVFSGSGVPRSVGGENCREIIHEVVKTKLNLNIAVSDISTAHRYGSVPTGTQQDRRGIIVKLCRRDLKKDLLSSCRTVKPDFYVNESLTPLRNTIMYVLRQIKRKHPDKVSGCSSRDGKVFAWVKPQNASSSSAGNTKVPINSHTRLDLFCTETINRPLSSFIEIWPH